MKIYSKEESIKHLRNECFQVFKWECPNCCEVFESSEGETKSEFLKHITNSVRYVDMKYMSGLLCSECYNDKEVQNSSL